MKRLVEKMDLQDQRKADLIDLVLGKALVNENTKAPYSLKDLEVLSYDELVDIIVDSKKFYRIFYPPLN